MGISRKNSEGYMDMTAHEGVRAAEKKPKRRMVYICSPYAGDVAGNTQRAILYCRFTIEQGFMPVASHLLYPQILDDKSMAERELGLAFGLKLLRACSQVWVFTDGESGISKGMKAEIAEAGRCRKRIRYFTTKLVENGG